jgi:hypothetical protein
LEQIQQDLPRLAIGHLLPERLDELPPLQWLRYLGAPLLNLKERLILRGHHLLYHPHRK